MKRKLMIFIAMLLALFFSVSLSSKISAKTVSSNDFTVTSGNDEYTYIYTEQTQDSYKIYLKVELNPEKNIDETEPIYQYQWTHKFEIYDGDTLLIQEEDVLPDSGTNYFTKNTRYSVTFGTEEGIIAGQTLQEDTIYKVKFYNKFTCIDCPDDYEYKEQELETMELKLDISLPTIDTTELENALIHISSSSIAIENGAIFDIRVEDNESGIDSAAFLFSSRSYTYVDDMLNDDNTSTFRDSMYGIADIRASSNVEGYLQTQTLFGPQYVYYYIYLYAKDYAGNVVTKYYPVMIHMSKDDETLSYSGSIEEEGTTNEIVLDIVPNYDTYYILSTSPIVEYSDITAQYTDSITLGTEDNGEVYLHMIQYVGTNVYKLSRKYTLDTVKPTLDTTSSTIPSTTRSYNSLVIKPVFKDTYTSGYYIYQGSGVKEVTYGIFDEPMDMTDYDLFGVSFTDKIELPSPTEGNLYLYIKAIDNAGNITVVEYHYLIDRTDPVISILDYTHSDAPSKTPFVKFDIEDDYDYTTKQGWFKDGIIPEKKDLTKSYAVKENAVIDVTDDGEYRLWIYAIDEAGNESMIYSPVVCVDRLGPSVSFTVEHDDEIYRYTNKITLTFEDTYSSINSTFKYGWFKYNTTVNKTMLTKESESNILDYPKDLYGKYYLYVLVTDVLGNETFTKIDKVCYIDTDKVIISLYGENEVTVLRRGRYEEEGAIAYKTSDHSVRVNVVISSDLDINKAGKYTIVYTAGEGELQTSITRTIIVEETNQYYIATAAIFIGGILISVLSMLVRKRRTKTC